MLDKFDASAGRTSEENYDAEPERTARQNPPRPAIVPPSPLDDGKQRVYPPTYRTLTREDVLEILKTLGPSTRAEMFEHVFGPSHLAACSNVSGWVHKAISSLERDKRIHTTRSRGRSEIWELSDGSGPDLPPSGLFAHSAEPQQDPDIVPAPPVRAAEIARSAARIFVEDVVQGSIKIPLVDTEAAEALVAGIFADPHSPLPEAALVAGWRSDLADMAYASSPALRAVRFAGLDIDQAEAAFNEVVSGYDLGPTDHGPALRIVIDALSGTDGTDGNDAKAYGQAWMADAFAQLRSPPAPDPLPAPTAATNPVRRARGSRPALAGRTPSPAPVAAPTPARRGISEILKAKALVDFESESPVGKILSRYAPMIRQAMDAGATPEEIASRFITDGGMQIPAEMAVILIRRVYACER